MRIGIDFDNTIACYDGVFHAAALERGLIPAELGRDKNSVRDYLNGAGRNDDFTELQGHVYGVRMDLVAAYPGFSDFVAAASAAGHELFIVSHKTVLAHHDPFETNLRDSALRFMQQQGFFDEQGFGLEPGQVFFEGTREEKIRRIGELDCHIFVDDLPEVLAHAGMPPACRKILFRAEQPGPFERAANWTEVCDAVFKRS